MDKNIELQEVKELQNRFQASATELNQQFECLMQKYLILQRLTFQGKLLLILKLFIYSSWKYYF